MSARIIHLSKHLFFVPCHLRWSIYRCAYICMTVEVTLFVPEIYRSHIIRGLPLDLGQKINGINILLASKWNLMLAEGSQCVNLPRSSNSFPNIKQNWAYR